MLVNRHDAVAAEYGDRYLENIDNDLLKFAIINNNEIFLKYGFRN